MQPKPDWVAAVHPSKSSGGGRAPFAGFDSRLTAFGSRLLLPAHVTEPHDDDHHDRDPSRLSRRAPTEFSNGHGARRARCRCWTEWRLDTPSLASQAPGPQS